MVLKTKKMKEFKVEKEFVIKVVEHDENKMPCTGCFFNSDDIACVGNCSANERSDHKNVIFKQVKRSKAYESKRTYNR